MGTASLKPSINATAYHPIFFDTSKSLSVIDKDRRSAPQPQLPSSTVKPNHWTPARRGDRGKAGRTPPGQRPALALTRIPTGASARHPCCLDPPHRGMA